MRLNWSPKRSRYFLHKVGTSPFQTYHLNQRSMEIVRGRESVLTMGYSSPNSITWLSFRNFRIRMINKHKNGFISCIRIFEKGGILVYGTVYSKCVLFNSKSMKKRCHLANCKIGLIQNVCFIGDRMVLVGQDSVKLMDLQGSQYKNVRFPFMDTIRIKHLLVLPKRSSRSTSTSLQLVFSKKNINKLFSFQVDVAD